MAPLVPSLLPDRVYPCEVDKRLSSVGPVQRA